MIGRPPKSTLFPYTTLSRSREAEGLRFRPLGQSPPLCYAGRSRRLLPGDRKSTRLNSSHLGISYAVFCLKKKQNPCIVMWVPYNEGWCQWDPARVFAKIKTLDRTRLVDNAIGWSGRGVGDFFFMDTAPTAFSPFPHPNPLPI